jgi:hypothetical protein
MLKEIELQHNMQNTNNQRPSERSDNEQRAEAASEDDGLVTGGTFRVVCCGTRVAPPKALRRCRIDRRRGGRRGSSHSAVTCLFVWTPRVRMLTLSCNAAPSTRCSASGSAVATVFLVTAVLAAICFMALSVFDPSLVHRVNYLIKGAGSEYLKPHPRFQGFRAGTSAHPDDHHARARVRHQTGPWCCGSGGSDMNEITHRLKTARAEFRNAQRAARCAARRVTAGTRSLEPFSVRSFGPNRKPRSRVACLFGVLPQPVCRRGGLPVVVHGGVQRRGPHRAAHSGDGSGASAPWERWPGVVRPAVARAH